jgi:hypothetical protein
MQCTIGWSKCGKRAAFKFQRTVRTQRSDSQKIDINSAARFGQSTEVLRSVLYAADHVGRSGVE